MYCDVGLPKFGVGWRVWLGTWKVSRTAWLQLWLVGRTRSHQLRSTSAGNNSPNDKLLDPGANDGLLVFHLLRLRLLQVVVLAGAAGGVWGMGWTMGCCRQWAAWGPGPRDDRYRAVTIMAVEAESHQQAVRWATRPKTQAQSDPEPPQHTKLCSFWARRLLPRLHDRQTSSDDQRHGEIAVPRILPARVWGRPRTPAGIQGRRDHSSGLFWPPGRAGQTP